MDAFQKLIIQLEEIQSFGDQAGSALLDVSAHIFSTYKQESFNLLTKLGILLKFKNAEDFRKTIAIYQVEINETKVVLSLNQSKKTIFADIPNVREYLASNNIDLTKGEGLFVLGILLQPKNLINFTILYHQKELMKAIES